MVADLGRDRDQNTESSAHEEDNNQGGERSSPRGDGSGEREDHDANDETYELKAPADASPEHKMTKDELLSALRKLEMEHEETKKELRRRSAGRATEALERESYDMPSKPKTPSTKSSSAMEMAARRASDEAKEEARAREDAKEERERRRDEATELRHALTTTADERSLYKFEPTRHGIATTLTDAIAYLSKKHTACMPWRRMLMDDSVTVEMAMGIIEADATCAKVDRFFHASVIALIDKSSKLGVLFTDEERELDSKDPRKASSGYALCKRLDGFGAIEELDEAREHMKKVLGKNVLKCGAEEADTKTKINRIIDGQKELPTEMRAVMPILSMVIDAVPDDIQESVNRTFKQRLHQERTEHKKLNGGKEKYTIEELKIVIAVRLKLTQPNPSAFAATTPRGEKGGGKKTAGAKGSKAKAQEGKACFVCGKTTCGGYLTCTVRCELGRAKWCPCNHGAPCVFKMATMPPREQVKDGVGEPLYQTKYDDLCEKHKTYKTGNAAAAQEEDEEEYDATSCCVCLASPEAEEESSPGETQVLSTILIKRSVIRIGD